MRSLDSKEKVTFHCTDHPALQQRCYKTARCAARSQTPPEPQIKQAPISGIYQVRAAQAAQWLPCLLLLLQSSSLSSYSLGFHDLARLHLTYWNNVLSHYIICWSLTPALHLGNCEAILRLFSPTKKSSLSMFYPFWQHYRELRKPGKIFTFGQNHYILGRHVHQLAWPRESYQLCRLFQP